MFVFKINGSAPPKHIEGKSQISGKPYSFWRTGHVIEFSSKHGDGKPQGFGGGPGGKNEQGEPVDFKPNEGWMSMEGQTQIEKNTICQVDASQISAKSKDGKLFFSIRGDIKNQSGEVVLSASDHKQSSSTPTSTPPTMDMSIFDKMATNLEKCAKIWEGIHATIIEIAGRMPVDRERSINREIDNAFPAKEPSKMPAEDDSEFPF